MLHVRAMFRVLSISRDYSKKSLIKLGPTYASRDGIPCEENKSFSKWTPSGDCELSTEPGDFFPRGNTRGSSCFRRPGRIRTYVRRVQSPLPIHSATGPKFSRAEPERADAG